EFGVAKGEDFAALVSAYLSPNSFANQPDYLFEQTTDANGGAVADRSQEVYALSLEDWMRSIAGDVISRYETAARVKTPGPDAPPLIQFMEGLQNGSTPTFAQALSFLPQVSDRTMPLIPWLQLHESAALAAAYGAQDVTYAQAYALFQTLPALTQR